MPVHNFFKSLLLLNLLITDNLENHYLHSASINDYAETVWVNARVA